MTLGDLRRSNEVRRAGPREGKTRRLASGTTGSGAVGIGPSRTILEIEKALRRCAIELAYINHGVENCNSGLCATTEGNECIEEAERLLGPMKDWPEVKE